MKPSRVLTLAVCLSFWLSGTAGAAQPADKIPFPPVPSELQTDAAWIYWNSHYSLDAAVTLWRSGIWNPIPGHHPDEPIPQSEFVNLLLKVTGQEIPLREDVQTIPTEPVTRGQAAKRVEELTSFNTGIANSKPSFSDYDEQSPFASSMSYVYHTGIMLGNGEQFLPNEPLTRGQAALVLSRVLMRMPQMSRPSSFEHMNSPLPEPAKAMAEKNKSTFGLYSVTDGQVRYLMVAAGEQPSAGYSVTIDSIRETQNALYVQARLNSPEPGEPVAQVITYPYQIVKLTNTTKPVYLLP
jgi:hypothetical protein